MVLQTNHAANYANALLKSLSVSEQVSAQMDHPARAWQCSALEDITGFPLPTLLASHAEGTLMALKALYPKAQLPSFGAQLLSERARLRGIKCDGRITAGGYGRVLDALDGRIALNLVREDDWDLIPAWLEADATSWAEIERFTREKPMSHWVHRGVELGLAVAKESLPERPQTWFFKQDFEKKGCEAPLIVDLSGLWAAPLASSLLSLTGARIIKVESPNRPDGMRRGHKGFYDLINAGKDCVSLDFGDAADLDKLKSLLDRADGVIEASRPRALRQLGIVAEEFVNRKPGKVWARLTAYGQDQNRIGFGDDIGVSSGLSTLLYRTHRKVGFVGDAIADPISGLHLALAMGASFKQDGGAVIDMAMHEVLRFAMGDVPSDLTGLIEEWERFTDYESVPLYPLRTSVGVGKAIGENNKDWLC